MNNSSRARNVSDLIRQHYALVYRYALRLSGQEADAEDVVQQTFLTAQARFDQLRDPARAKAWLCTIARNIYLKRFRREYAVSVLSLESVAEPEQIGAVEPDIDPEYLQIVLNDLPEEFRTPVVLFYFKEFSYREIAEHVDVPLGTVMSRLARAKACLRRRLSSREPVGT